MTTEEQIDALAKLDGFNGLIYAHNHCWRGIKLREPEDYNSDETLPDYLTSYDAIIPLVQRQDYKTIRATVSLLCLNIIPCQQSITATPVQLCEALLRATGKWTT